MKSKILVKASDGTRELSLLVIGGSLEGITDALVGDAPSSDDFFGTLDREVVVKLDSSWVNEVGYNHVTRTLRLGTSELRDLTYLDVPVLFFQGLVTAKSAGQYYNWHIKHNFTLQR